MKLMISSEIQNITKNLTIKCRYIKSILTNSAHPESPSKKYLKVIYNTGR